ncbi:hypothetical protein BH09BAC1_BH09BAC1_00350 [soil metagenome]
MKRLLVLGLATIGFGVASQAQTLERQVIGSAGGYEVENGYSLSFTVGEPVVETAINGSLILTQGFQQPDDVSVGINNVVKIKMDYSIFPNPTMDHITVQLSADKVVEITISLHDIMGRKLELMDRTVIVDGIVKQQYDLSNLAAANYMVVLTDKSGQQVGQFKIQKLTY